MPATRPHLRAVQFSSPAIVCAVRPHGEHGAVVRLLTEERGLVAGYAAGARGRELRPVLIPGNTVMADLRGRVESQLPSLRVELVHSCGPWLAEPLASAGLGWAAALTAATLPEGQAYPRLHMALAALIDAICHAPSARGWSLALAGYEELALRELGYGADLPPLSRDAEWDAIIARLDRLGQRIAARLLADRRGDVMGARSILLDRLKRIEGSA